MPKGWVLGLCNIVGVQRNWELLRERIVDVWLSGLPDLPEPDDPDLTSITLSEMPVHCLVSDVHPLLNHTTLSFEDLQPFPSLALEDNTYPKVEAALKKVGLWALPLDLPIQSGEALVVRREFVDSPPFRQLAHTIHHRLSQLAVRLSEIQMKPLPFSDSSGTGEAPPHPEL